MLDFAFKIKRANLLFEFFHSGIEVRVVRDVFDIVQFNLASLFALNHSIHSDGQGVVHQRLDHVVIHKDHMLALISKFRRFLPSNRAGLKVLVLPHVLALRLER